jgi:hypothetical protein
MKAMRYAALIVAAGLFITGCKAPVYVQKDESANLNSYKTYSWVDTRKDENDKSAKATAFADISIRNAANKALAKTGWREVKSNPDVLISYDILVEKSMQRQSDPVYSRGFTRMYYNPYMRRWGTIYYPSQFLGYESYQTPIKEGTITITMMDTKTDKAVWQGWTTHTIDGNRLSKDEISSAVSNIFRKLDVAKM